MSFSNLNISKKLMLGFAGVIIVVAAMCAGLFMSLQSIKTAVAQNDIEVAELKDADAVLMAMVERTNAFRGFVANGDKSFEGKIDEASKTFNETIADWTKIAPEDAGKIAAIKAAGDEVGAQQDSNLVKARDPAKRGEAQATLTTVGRLTKLRDGLKAYTDEEEANLKQRAAAQTKTQAVAELTLPLARAWRSSFRS